MNGCACAIDYICFFQCGFAVVTSHDAESFKGENNFVSSKSGNRNGKRVQRQAKAEYGMCNTRGSGSSSNCELKILRHSLRILPFLLSPPIPGIREMASTNLSSLRSHLARSITPRVASDRCGSDVHGLCTNVTSPLGAQNNSYMIRILSSFDPRSMTLCM
jgi:hypothetical protein